MDDQKLAFKSEEERMEALNALPTRPPNDVGDLDAWEAEIEKKQQQILEAQVDPNAVEAPAEEPPRQEEAPAEEAQTSDEDKLFFGKYKRDDLPEPLRKYNSDEQVLEQAAHARDYATKTEQRMQQLGQDLAEGKKENEKLQERIKELEQKKDELASDSADKFQTVRQKEAAQQQIDKLSESISKLKSLEDDDIVSAKDVRPFLNTAIEEINSIRNKVVSANQNPAVDKRIKELEGKLEESIRLNKEAASAQKQKQYAEAFRKDIETLQSKYEELKTSKTPFAPAGSAEENVESSIVKMCERIADKNITSSDWPLVNRIVNGINNNSPDVINYCKGKGIMLEDFGLTAQDMKAYALIASINAHRQGKVVDPNSGNVVDRLDFMGNRVTFPNSESAYRDMLDASGVSDKEMDQKLKEAERNGIKSVQSALSRRDTSPQTIGNEGGGSAENIGKEMSVEHAQAVLADKKYSEDMERLLLIGEVEGLERLRILNRARRTVGLPEVPVDPEWRVEIPAQ